MLRILRETLIPLPGNVFPPIESDLQSYRHLLRGKVLNVGAGWRQISHIIEGDLINQDIALEDEKRTHIDIYSPIHQVPVPDDYFDAILCLAVLEHIENPEEAVPELYRVLKKGGHLVLGVPFLQPEHKVPTDFQRYTKDGLVRLVTHHGFRVKEVSAAYSVYQTLYWILWEWLNLKDSFGYKLLRVILLPFFAFRCRNSKTQSDKLASAFVLVATK